ncbi:MAG TPA: M56 family metallopeptidase [Actinospica sp.]|nr:M56 family metallopeptidase [Actinospica sp.]
MRVLILFSLLFPLAAGPLAKAVTARVEPMLGTWLMTAAALLLAGTSCGSLGLLVLSPLVGMTWVANLGHWSSSIVAGAGLPGGWTSLAAAVMLGAALLAAAAFAVRRGRALAFAWQHARSLPGHGDLVVTEDSAADAYAVPGWPGRIVVSEGMLGALDDHGRAALLAHERAHLANHHHWFTAVARLAAAANPLVRPLASAVEYSVERWADEAAASEVGDRHLVARAIASAAIAAKATKATSGMKSAMTGALDAIGPRTSRLPRLVRMRGVPKWPGIRPGSGSKAANRLEGDSEDRAVIESDNRSGIGSGIEAGAGSEAGAGVGSGIETGAGSEAGTGIDAGVGAGIEAGAGTGVKAGIGAGLEAGIGAGICAQVARRRHVLGRLGRDGDEPTAAGVSPQLTAGRDRRALTWTVRDGDEPTAAGASPQLMAGRDRRTLTWTVRDGDGPAAAGASPQLMAGRERRTLSRTVRDGDGPTAVGPVPRRVAGRRRVFGWTMREGDGLAGAGPVPRRVAALLGPAPSTRRGLPTLAASLVFLGVVAVCALVAADHLQDLLSFAHATVDRSLRAPSPAGSSTLL